MTFEIVVNLNLLKIENKLRLGLNNGSLKQGLLLNYNCESVRYS